MDTRHHHQCASSSPIYSRIRSCFHFRRSSRSHSSTSASMGEKESNNNETKKKNKGEGGKNNGDDANKAIEVVLKVDMHCGGCCDKLKKHVERFDGVEAVRGDSDTNKLTVIGKVDPTELQEKIAQKTKKKVELISPKPNKNKDSNGGGSGGRSGDKKSENKSEKKEKSDDKKTKEKEPPVTTAVLRIALHCEGCVRSIHRVISKAKGFHSMSIDKQKDLVTVTGSVDMKALAESLKEKLKRHVEIVPPKKEKESGGGGDGGGEKGKKGKGGGGGDGGKKEEVNKMDFAGYGYGPEFGYAPNYGLVQGYNYNMAYGNGAGGGYEVGYPEGATYAVERLHAPQLFSDENPNACSVM